MTIRSKFDNTPLTGEPAARSFDGYVNVTFEMNEKGYIRLVSEVIYPYEVTIGNWTWYQGIAILTIGEDGPITRKFIGVSANFEGDLPHETPLMLNTGYPITY